MSTVLSLDDYLNNPELIDFKETPKKSVSKETKLKPARTSVVTKQPNPESVDTIGNSLTKSARKKIELYLKKSPQFKTIQKQIELLKAEADKYKLDNLDELYTATIQLISELTKKSHSFIKLYKNNSWEKDKAESESKIKNSEYLKQLKEERKILETQYKKLNPNSLLYEVQNLRKGLNIEETEEIDYGFEDNDIINSIDEELQNLNQNEIVQTYNNLCGHIADLLDRMPSEIYAMPINNLRKLLINDNDLKVQANAIQEKLNQNRINNQKEISNLKGNNDITNIIFDIFDFETTPEEQPKELLAAANVNYVKSIAYNMCSRINALHNLDDATAYGLMGLSLAVDKWYGYQKMSDSPISFSGFAHQYITNAIKRGLNELSSGGMISKSTMGTLDTMRKKLRTTFLQTNPELRDLPEEMLEALVDGVYGDKPASVVSESSYSNTVGGDEETADIWANAAVSNVDDVKFTETKMEYELLLKSIKNLFNLFETKTDAKGNKIETGFKIFDKYDYKLFKLYFGLEFKREAVQNKFTVDNHYNQEEIAKIMVDYYAINGITKTFSQAAISSRIQALLNKIKKVMDENSGIKSGFEYIYNSCLANSEMMNYFSNNREEFEIKMNRDELRDIYSDNDQELSRQLSDGKTLSDMYDVNDDNPFDEEIANNFRNY